MRGRLDLGRFERLRARPEHRVPHPRDLQNRHSGLYFVDDGSAAYRFCPACGGRARTRLLKAGDPERLVCVRLRVRVLSRSEGRGRHDHPRRRTSSSSLVRRAIEPGYGLWVFPGGYVDRGEEVTAAAIREAREESGLDVRLDRSSTSTRIGGRAPIIVVYAATALGGELCGDDECLEARLFQPMRSHGRARVPQHRRGAAGLFQDRAAELGTEMTHRVTSAHGDPRWYTSGLPCIIPGVPSAAMST